MHDDFNRVRFYGDNCLGPFNCLEQEVLRDGGVELDNVKLEEFVGAFVWQLIEPFNDIFATLPLV